MKNIKILLSLILLVLIAMLLILFITNYSQLFKPEMTHFYGIILENDQPVPNARIEVIDQTKYTFSDENGAFFLDVKGQKGDSIDYIISLDGVERYKGRSKLPLPLTVDLADKK